MFALVKSTARLAVRILADIKKILRFLVFLRSLKFDVRPPKLFLLLKVYLKKDGFMGILEIF